MIIGAVNVYKEEEEDIWHSEYLQHIAEGENTKKLYEHFNQWSLAQIPNNERDTLPDEISMTLGRGYATYPLRIYRILQNIGYTPRGKEDIKEKIWDGCLRIGKGLKILRGEKINRPNKYYTEKAKEWIEKSNGKVLVKAEVSRLARSFMHMDMFAMGLEIAGKLIPEILSKYVLTYGLPARPLPNYPQHFILFALNRFLEQTKYKSHNLSKYKLLSGFLNEQDLKINMSEEYIKKVLQRQRKNKHFSEELKCFYEICQEAYLWPFIYAEDIAAGKMLRVLIDKPDLVTPYLSILFPDWEEVF